MWSPIWFVCLLFGLQSPTELTLPRAHHLRLHHLHRQDPRPPLPALPHILPRRRSHPGFLVLLSEKLNPNIFQVAILLYMCQILVYWMWKRGVDPDNAAIPYLTAVLSLSHKIMCNNTIKLWYKHTLCLSYSFFRLEIFWAQVFWQWPSLHWRRLVFVPPFPLPFQNTHITTKCKT